MVLQRSSNDSTSSTSQLLHPSLHPQHSKKLSSSSSSIEIATEDGDEKENTMPNAPSFENIDTTPACGEDDMDHTNRNPIVPREQQQPRQQRQQRQQQQQPPGVEVELRHAPAAAPAAPPASKSKGISPVSQSSSDVSSILPIHHDFSSSNGRGVSFVSSSGTSSNATGSPYTTSVAELYTHNRNYPPPHSSHRAGGAGGDEEEGGGGDRGGESNRYGTSSSPRSNWMDRSRPSPPPLPLRSPPLHSPKGRKTTSHVLPLTERGENHNHNGGGSSVLSHGSEYYNQMAEAHTMENRDAHQNCPFYESDADMEGGSVIYTGRRAAGGGGGGGRVGDQRSPSMDSVGMGSLAQQSIGGGGPPLAPYRVQATPMRSTANTTSTMDATPHISNITNNNRSSSNNNNNNADDNAMMPYQTRIAERQRVSYDASESDQAPSTIYDRNFPLSTISSPHRQQHPKHSPPPPHDRMNNVYANTTATPQTTNNYPSNSDNAAEEFAPLTHQTLSQQPPQQQQQQQQRAPPLHPNYPPRAQHYPPPHPQQQQPQPEYDGSRFQPGNNLNPHHTIVHVRKDSGDTVSTFGSWMGGASLCPPPPEEDHHHDPQYHPHQQQQSYNRNHNQNIHNHDSQPFPYRSNTNTTDEKQKKDTAPKSVNSGIFSSILGSFSFGSNTSLQSVDVQSVEDATYDLHEKSQAFLQKKPMSDLSSLRSISPVPQRTHRPKLDSIDEGKKGGNANDNNDHPHPTHTPSNYGSTNMGNGNNSGGKNVSLDATMKMSNRAGARSPLSSVFSSGTSSEDDDDSGISSDFTSNQDGSGNGNSSSMKLDSSSEGDLSYDEDPTNQVYRNERTALLPPSGDSTYEHGSTYEHEPRRPSDSSSSRSNNNGSVAASSRSRKERRRNGRTPPGEREERHRTGRKKRRHYEGGRNGRRNDGSGRQNRDRSLEMEERRRRPDGNDGRYRSYRHDNMEREPRYSQHNIERPRRNNNRRERYGRERDSEERMYQYMKNKIFLEYEEMRILRERGLREEQEFNRWDNRLYRWVGTNYEKLEPYKLNVEQFISNLPLTIGAVALAIVTLGVVWFKFAEEMLQSCQPVHFHSSQCSFHEFPGCFYCDTSSRIYQVAFKIHTGCSLLAGTISMLFFAKVFLARRVVLDEMNQPTTSSPAGLICMTTVCVFAGRGTIGQIMVTIAAGLHFCLAAWFIYMAIRYQILPDPSWYPNTVGIGISAVKIWLYYPIAGHFLMATSLSLGFFFFPISLFRVALNKKISAPVAWIQMSAPAVSLYALTIMAQPSFKEEHPDITQFQRVHRLIYMPCMHFLFIMAIVGAISSVQGLKTRWTTFSNKAFSPAHAAFCFPALAHVNAIQAYRGAVDTFSEIGPKSTFKIALDTYWFSTLILSTIASIIITAKFFYMLPSWTLMDVLDEMEPPEPGATQLSKYILDGDGETLRQDFVSPAVLQANETGALVRLPGRRHGETKYRRTRRVTALGFDPIMNLIEFNEERDALLAYVEKNPPRTRNRTLSVPHITCTFGQFGTNNSGVYNGRQDMGITRARTHTSDGYSHCDNTVI